MKTSVSLTAYNHTEHGVGSYRVILEDGASAGAGYLDPGAGGGGANLLSFNTISLEAGHESNGSHEYDQGRERY